MSTAPARKPDARRAGGMAWRMEQAERGLLDSLLAELDVLERGIEDLGPGERAEAERALQELQARIDRQLGDSRELRDQVAATIEDLKGCIATAETRSKNAAAALARYKRADRTLKDAALRTIEAMGCGQLEGDEYAIVSCANGGAETLEPLDLEALLASGDPRFVKMEPAIDSEALRAYLEQQPDKTLRIRVLRDGQEAEVEVARLRRGKHVRIKMV